MNFTTIDQKGTVEGYAIVKSCERKQSKNMKDYFDMVICQKSSEMRAKLWTPQNLSEFLPNDFVKIRGTISEYNNALQFSINKIRLVTDADEVDINDYLVISEFPGEDMFNELLDLAESITDDDFAQLVISIYEDYHDELIAWPAAASLHHAMQGGLLYHTLSMARTADFLSKLYPTIDRDLLLCGTLLHDIAKISEFKLNDSGLVEKYTTAGRLVGHLVMGAILIDRYGREMGMPEDKIMLIEHMLISHHGEPEFGCAVRPLFLEAEILSSIDTLDAKIYEFEKATCDVNKDEFSTRQWALNDRNLYNHGRKTIETKAELFKKGQ